MLKITENHRDGLILDLAAKIFLKKIFMREDSGKRPFEDGGLDVCASMSLDGAQEFYDQAVQDGYLEISS